MLSKERNTHQLVEAGNKRQVIKSQDLFILDQLLPNLYRRPDLASQKYPRGCCGGEVFPFCATASIFGGSGYPETVSVKIGSKKWRLQHRMESHDQTGNFGMQRAEVWRLLF